MYVVPVRGNTTNAIIVLLAIAAVLITELQSKTVKYYERRLWSMSFHQLSLNDTPLPHLVITTRTWYDI